MGRPTTYKPEYCEKVKAYMSQGYSKEATASEIGIHRATLYKWANKFPEFGDAIKRAEGLSFLFWEKLGINGIIHGGSSFR